MDEQSPKGMHELVEELQRRLFAGESFDNPKLTEIADGAFGGTCAQGVYTSRDAYDAMEAAVNKYLLATARSLLAHGASAFTVLNDLTERLATQTDRTLEQSEFQQFSTPPALALLAAKLLDLKQDDVALEPSAGTGSLAIWPHSMGLRVICNEINERRRALLQTELGLETHAVDAEMLNDVLPAEIRPTVILMNPPFTATGGRVTQHHGKYGLRHIESALQRLAEGGRLVAIAGENLSFERPAFTGWWQKIAGSYNVRANYGLDGKLYRKYGTQWGVQILVIDKVGPTPGNNWKRQLGNIAWGKAESLEQAWAALECVSKREALAQLDVDPGKERSSHSDLFVPYVVPKLRGGKDHPAVIVEAASMASVIPPNPTYRPHLPREVVTEGRLSRIQMERVIYAGQRHEQRLPDGARAGFNLGDGTGVGKGRVLAAIIADNWFQGRRRALWLSVNNNLLEAARRDLNDLGVDIQLAKINDYPAAEAITLSKGVIFSSYSSLIAGAKSGQRRLDQIQKWLGTEAVIIFDEGHKAKNALAGGRGEPTQTGQSVIDLQDPERNPEYRVVYSSATGATDVRNMAYMTRLGLWGTGTSFPGGFKEFLGEVDSGGVGAMEMVVRDMRSLGMYCSGSISFGVDPQSGKAVEYRERIHSLTDEQKSMYNRAAAAWRFVLQNIHRALDLTNAGFRQRGNAFNKFWGDHQRFFRQVICAFKVPSTIEEVEAALRDGKSAVISLVGTGEAKTREQVAKATAEGGNLEDLDFSPREIIGALIERAFPTQVYQDATDPVTHAIVKVAAKDASGNPVLSQEALQLKQKLLDGLSTLHLPENPLDQLVNHFGERNVAEITGRTRRLIRNKGTGTVEYKKRSLEGVPMLQVNLHEMERFQSERCRIAIISDAGSIGISLHASNQAANRQRRVHITLELGWSADKQIQCFGRTHRSDQAEPPEYVLLHTELGGEKRFSSTIARRLASLGALTKGDRGAADNADWARYNFETQEGRWALMLLYKRILDGETVRGLKNPRQVLRDMGLLVFREGGEDIRQDDLTNIPRFLNRVLSLDVAPQNALFDYFTELFDQTVRYAKANGTFDEGVTDIKAVAIRIAKPPAVVHVDKVTGAETILYTLDVDRPADTVDFARAKRLHFSYGGTFFQHRKTKNFVLALQSGRQTDPVKGKTFVSYSLWKPEAAYDSYIHDSELAEKYAAVIPDRAEQWWRARYAAAPRIHTTHVHIIAGAIVPLWQRLKTEEDSKLRVTRVGTGDGQRIVGVTIPPTKVRSVLRAIGTNQSSSNEPEKMFREVLDDDDEISLVSGLRLKRSKLHGSWAIELLCNDANRFGELRGMGLINEQIKFRQRFFVPTDEKKGLPILSKLVAQYPVMLDEKDDPDQSSLASLVIEPVEPVVIDLEEWLVPPEDATPLSPLDVVDVDTEAISELPVEAGLPDAFIWTEHPGSVSVQPLLWELADRLTKPTTRRRGKPRPVVEEQGFLFSLQ
jgi:hypothetical protein